MKRRHRIPGILIASSRNYNNIKGNTWVNEIVTELEAKKAYVMCFDKKIYLSHNEVSQMSKNIVICYE